MIRDAGGTASFQRTDVLVAAEIKALVDHAVTTYGRLDMAFNNAGIQVPPSDAADEPAENFDRVNPDSPDRQPIRVRSWTA